jgi:hypothetical protein
LSFSYALKQDAELPPPSPALATPSKKRPHDQISASSPVANMNMEDEEEHPNSPQITIQPPLKPIVPLSVGDEICYFDRVSSLKISFT